MLLKDRGRDEFINKISDPDALFHYTNRVTALEGIFSSGVFLFSPLSKTNDPYEYKSKLIGATGWGWEESDHDLIHLAVEYIDGLFEHRMLFISFCRNECENKEIISQGFLKPRMWSQYGDGNKGVCLAISGANMIKEIENIRKKDQMIFNGKVCYSDDISRLKGLNIMINGGELTHDNVREYMIRHISQFEKQLLFTKHDDYKDEDEYRVILLDSSENGELRGIKIDLSSILIGVIVGDRFPDVYRPIIKDISEKYKVEVRRLHWESDEYIMLNEFD